MSWLFFALISAVLTSTAALIEKKSLRSEHAAEFGATLAFTCFLLTLPVLFFIDYHAVGFLPIAVLFAIGFFATIGFLFVSKAFRHMEVSAVSPLSSLRPGMISILAFVFLGEALSRQQVVGLGLLLAGTYILESHREDRLLDPLRNLLRSTYAKYMLFGLLVYSASAILDRFILANYEIGAWEYLAIAQTFVALNFFILLTVRYDGWRGIVNGFRMNGRSIAVVSLLTVAYRIADVFAVKVAYVGLVAAVRSLSVFFTTFVGGELFHEKNLARKTVAAAIMLGGAALIAL